MSAILPIIRHYSSAFSQRGLGFKGGSKLYECVPPFTIKICYISVSLEHVYEGSLPSFFRHFVKW